MPNLDDGTTDHHGPVAPGRGQHGGEGDQGDHLLAELQTDHPGVCLLEGRGYAYRGW